MFLALALSVFFIDVSGPVFLTGESRVSGELSFNRLFALTEPACFAVVARAQVGIQVVGRQGAF